MNLARIVVDALTGPEDRADSDPPYRESYPTDVRRLIRSAFTRLTVQDKILTAAREDGWNVTLKYMDEWVPHYNQWKPENAKLVKLVFMIEISGFKA